MISLFSADSKEFRVTAHVCNCATATLDLAAWAGPEGLDSSTTPQKLPPFPSAGVGWLHFLLLGGRSYACASTVHTMMDQCDGMISAE